MRENTALDSRFLESRWERETFDYNKFHYRQALVLREVMARRPSSVLELGCGVGVLRAELVREVPEIVYYGCDISRSAVDQLVSENIIQLDLNKDRISRFRRTFDCVIGSGVLEYVENLDVLFSDIYSALHGQDGRFIFSYFNDNHLSRLRTRFLGRAPYRHPEWRDLTSYQTLRRDLAEHGFEILVEKPVTIGFGPSPSIAALSRIRHPSVTRLLRGGPDLLWHQTIFSCRKRA